MRGTWGEVCNCKIHSLQYNKDCNISLTKGWPSDYESVGRQFESVRAYQALSIELAAAII
jgi:hypothetical protein